MQYKYTLPLDSASSDLSTTGGKGHNLAVLSRDGGLLVPGGFTVTVGAYRDFVSENRLRDKIENALSSGRRKEDAVVENGHDDSKEGATTKIDLENMEQVSGKIRDEFRRCKVSKALRAEITSRLEELIPDPNVTLAVRSSATCEDMPDASFAGQHDTYLNVARDKIDNVCSHVVDCFSSLFTSRAVSYRERNGLSHLDAGMAVVVQALVPSECSGVLFTANPLSGRRNETVLEAIPGLGEALVSGLTEPDRYVVSRKKGTPGEIQIKDVRVGAKLTAIYPTTGGGVKEEKKASDDAKAESSTVLTDEEVAELVGLGQKLEELFRNVPQDVEWARAGGKTYVVQSRPITTLFPLPAEAPADGPMQVYFNFGAVQGVQAPFYPAGADGIRNALGGVVRHASWGRRGMNMKEVIPRVGGRLYINATPPLRNSVGRAVIRKALAAIEPGIRCGIDEVLPNLEIDGGMSPFIALRLAYALAFVVPRFIYTFLFPNRSREFVTRMVDDRVESIKREADKTSSLAEVVDFKEKTLTGFFPNLYSHFIPRMAGGMSPLLLLKRLASGVPNGNDLVLMITRGLPHNVTTEMDLKLWEVAKAIRGDVESSKYMRGNDADALTKAYFENEMPDTAREAIRGFLDAYGMRGLYEIDFGRPRWREDPAPLLQTLKSYIEIDEEHAPDKVFAKGEVAAEEAVAQLAVATGKPRLVRFLARRIRSVAGIRELPKFTIIRIMGILREKYLREGNKLVERGLLDAARDISYLHDDELRSLAADDKSRDQKALVAERKAFMESESGRQVIPRVIASDGFAYIGGSRASSAVADDNTLLGEAVSPGVVEGTVHVVHDPSKSSLKPGEILVCHGTDPSWTPLFLVAGGLVMEVGGLMTHGSVVAREYGIPAVVGLEKVTERLRTGQKIRVDGSGGVVSILQDQKVSS